MSVSEPYLFLNILMSVLCSKVMLLFQESRQNRVDSWKQFQANSSAKKVKKLKTFKPPKHKAETR